jgi:Cu2+-exporting ATPase
MEAVTKDDSDEASSHADHAHSADGQDHEEYAGGGENHQGHHAEMVADFRRRFWVSLVATVPILALSPMIQQWLGVAAAWTFPGDLGLLLGLSTFVYGYGGWPFLTGMVDELRERTPGMMTLVALAISVAYLYSAAVVLGVPGEVFFWETVTLIDLMLVGHWINGGLSGDGARLLQGRRQSRGSGRSDRFRTRWLRCSGERWRGRVSFGDVQSDGPKI